MTARDGAELLGWMVLHGAWSAAAVAGVLALALRGADPRAAGLRHAAASAGLVLAVLLSPAVTTLALWTGAADSVPGGAGGAVETAPRAIAQVAGVLPWIGAAWLAAVAIGAARLAGGWRETRRLRRGGVHPAPAWWVDAMHLARRRTGVARTVGLFVSDGVDVPLVAGMRRPVVLIPRAVADALDARQAEAVLAHELMHVRRGDALANLAELAVEALFIHHPCVRWMAALARREREHCCDAAVVRLGANAATYARALATLEQLRPGRRLALAASDGELLERVRRLLAPAVTHRARPVRAAAVAAAGALCILGGAAEAAAWTAPRVADAASPRVLVRASDPAGDFTLVLRGGRVVEATVAGVRVSHRQVVQVRDSVTVLRGAAEPLRVQVRPDGIRWTARAPAR